ncbi:MAG: DNA recombination protein RmuC [Oscillospiraceae bacterium]|nr:DNA recombination protein RmuC [Oscillospiraceae bacterium]
MQTAIVIAAAAAAALGLLCAILLALLLKRSRPVDEAKLTDRVADEVIERLSPSLTGLKTELLSENRASRGESNAMVHMTMTAVSDALNASVNQQFRTFSEQNQAGLTAIRETVQTQLENLQRDNHSQLDRMRETVDEKLEKTLNERISQSFRLVNERLQEVYAGLGEMKALAGGVGDLKKVLSNVKTRGILGEYQLGALLAEILSPEQYEENVVTKPGSAQRVEFAIRLPGEGDAPVYLPVDAKFPGDTYAALAEAYDAGEPDRIASARAALDARIRAEAKDIHEKYVDPPHTTEFAILFLPFEGLYAEAVRMGLVEVLQRKYRVNLAGPTTFAALLNSLQMGFRTLAIQKRSGEVWTLLGAVKTEFGTFQTVLENAQKRIEQTGAELDKLVGVRTRKINSRLRGVSALPAEESARLLEEDAETED